VKEETVNGKVVSFYGKCLLCGKEIKPFQSMDGKTETVVWQRRPFIEHLIAYHGVDSDQICLELSTFRIL